MSVHFRSRNDFDRMSSVHEQLVVADIRLHSPVSSLLVNILNLIDIDGRVSFRTEVVFSYRGSPVAPNSLPLNSRKIVANLVHGYSSS
jgi:hypothetical protein